MGDSVNLTLSGDGSLSSVGGSENSTSLSLVAQDTGAAPTAFAVYRAPSNFSRGTPTNDDNIDQRTVSFQANLPDGTAITCPLTILRPPIMLVHGIWGSRRDWRSFTPLINDTSRKFYVGYADYNVDLHGGVTASVPGYTPEVLRDIRGNALGFDYAAPRVLDQIRQHIEDFRRDKQAAATQVDVIAHSMGGDISRTLINLPRYTGSRSFGAGYIHKVITIGTPHQGSQLAQQLIQGNVCVRNILATIGHNVTLFSATVPGYTPANPCTDLSGNSGTCGGAADLQPNSSAINRIQNGSGPLVPTAMIGATTTDANLASLECTCLFNSSNIFACARCPSGYIRGKCGQTDPLAQALTHQNWQTVFNGEANDGIVGISSQIMGPGGTAPFSGLIHSPGTAKLGFTGPSELDPATAGAPVAALQSLVVTLLNEPPQGSDFRPLR